MFTLSHRLSLLVLIAFIVVFSSGCDLVKSIEDKQVETCVKDVQRTLNDPNSIELLSYKKYGLKDGSWMLEIEYTYKNRMGGRDRDRSFCVFISKNSTQLKPDDMFNKMRDITGKLNSMGIDLKQLW